MVPIHILFDVVSNSSVNVSGNEFCEQESGDAAESGLIGLPRRGGCAVTQGRGAVQPQALHHRSDHQRDQVGGAER